MIVIRATELESNKHHVVKIIFLVLKERRKRCVLISLEYKNAKLLNINEHLKINMWPKLHLLLNSSTCVINENEDNFEV